jgi:hydrogenase maturation protein HypF
MKLESAAEKGTDALNLKPKIEGKTLNTTFLVHEIFNQRNNYSDADLACSAQSYIAKGLAELAIKEAERLSVKAIGFSGGVAYNEHITLAIRRMVEGSGFKFCVHNTVPPGDGGISLGQAIVAAYSN